MNERENAQLTEGDEALPTSFIIYPEYRVMIDIFLEKLLP